MPVARIVVAVVLLTGGLAVSACRPPTPKVVAQVVPHSTGTEPLATLNRSGQASQAQG